MKRRDCTFQPRTTSSYNPSDSATPHQLPLHRGAFWYQQTLRNLPLVFPAGKTAHPRRHLPTAGRLRSNRMREAHRKRSGDHRIELARIREIHSFFVSPAPNIYAHKRRFSGELERSFYLKSCLSNVLPHPRSIISSASCAVSTTHCAPAASISSRVRKP